MPVQKQYMQVDFTGGLDTKTDQRVVIPGNFTTANNVVYAKTGAVEKRPGMQFLTDNVFGGTFLPNARTLASYNDELLMIGEHKLFSLRSPETSFLDQDRVSECIGTRTSVSSVPPHASDFQAAYGSGQSVYVWWQTEDPAGPGVFNVYVSTVDDSGAVQFQNFRLNTVNNALSARLVVVGTIAIVMYQTSVGSNLYARTLDLANPTAWTAETIIATDMGGVLTLNYGATGLTDRFAVGYRNTFNDLMIRTFNTSLALISSASFASALTIRAVALDGDAVTGNLWIAFSATDSAADNRVRALRLASGTLAILTAIFNVTTSVDLGQHCLLVGIKVLSNGIDAVVVGNPSVMTYTSQTPIPGPTAPIPYSANGIWKRNVLATGVTSGPQSFTYSGTGLVSKPFVVDSRVYIAIAAVTGPSPTAPSGTIYIADIFADDTTAANIPMRPVCVLAPYQVAFAGSVIGTLNAVATKSPTRVVVPGAIVVGTQRAVSSFQIDFGEQFETAETNATLSLSGGVPSSYDGKTVAELGYLVRPITAQWTQVPVGGFLPGGVTYRYQVVFEWNDNTGQLYQSAPSDVVEINVPVGPATNLVSFRISNCGLTTKQETTLPEASAVRIQVYRASPTGSTVYRRLTGNLGINSPIFSDPNTAFFSFVDDGATAQETALQTAPIIYTAQQLQNDTPPSTKMLITHGQRVWLAGVDDPTQLWPSKILTEGEPPNFSSDFVFNIHDGGAITGLGSLDDKLIVFKKDRIYAVFGDGPNDLGAGGDFVIQQVASDKGCTDKLSVVLTPEGLMFRDSIGISMLSRGLEDSYFGAPVEDVVNAFPGVTSAKLHPTQPWVLFTLGPVVQAGVTVLYDYFHKRWAVWEYTDGSNAQLFTKSATVHKGKYIKTTVGTPVPAGAAHITRESTTNYTDDGVYVSMKIETAWLKFAGLMGFQRIRRIALLGKHYGPHNLEISLAHNYDESSYDQVNTYDSTTLNWDSEQFATYVVQQKCSSMRVKIRDLPNALGGTTRALSISGLGLEVGLKGNIFKLPIVQGG